MFRIFTTAFAALALVTSAHAGTLATHLTFDGAVDILDDDSVSFVIDRDGDMALSVGDIVSGVLRIGSTTANGVLAADDQLVGVYSIEIASSVGVPGADPTVLLTSTGVDPLDGTGYSIDEILSSAGIAAPSFGSSAAVAVLSSSGNPTDITTVPQASAIAALSSYTLDAILGFGMPDDYLEVRSFSDADDSGEIDFSELPPGPGFFAAEAGGMTILHHTMGSGTVFLPVASLHTDNSTITMHDVGILGTLFGPRANTPAGYTITDSTFFTVNAVPEPGSMAIWGVLIGAGVVAGRRRKKKTDV